MNAALVTQLFQELYYTRSITFQRLLAEENYVSNFDGPCIENLTILN